MKGRAIMKTILWADWPNELAGAFLQLGLGHRALITIIFELSVTAISHLGCTPPCSDRRGPNGAVSDLYCRDNMGRTHLFPAEPLLEHSKESLVCLSPLLVTEKNLGGIARRELIQCLH